MIHSHRLTRPSARILEKKLAEEGYDGPDICWGYRSGELNKKARWNKRLCLEIMAKAGAPTPKLYKIGDDMVFPVVGRPNQHKQGRGFWLCQDEHDLERAIKGTRKKRAATHFMQWIDAKREFRVHIMNDVSIKLSEKTPIGNHDKGAMFHYPDNFGYKRSLRNVARSAVEALELDFGAVDVLWDGEKFFVIEVNTCPRLTDPQSDTLERYVQGFVDYYS